MGFTSFPKRIYYRDITKGKHGYVTRDPKTREIKMCQATSTDFFRSEIKIETIDRYVDLLFLGITLHRFYALGREGSESIIRRVFLWVEKANKTYISVYKDKKFFGFMVPEEKFNGAYNYYPQGLDSRGEGRYINIEKYDGNESIPVIETFKSFKVLDMIAKLYIDGEAVLGFPFDSKVLKLDRPTVFVPQIVSILIRSYASAYICSKLKENEMLVIKSKSSSYRAPFVWDREAFSFSPSDGSLKSLGKVENIAKTDAHIRQPFMLVELLGKNRSIGVFAPRANDGGDMWSIYFKQLNETDNETEALVDAAMTALENINDIDYLRKLRPQDRSFAQIGYNNFIKDFGNTQFVKDLLFR